MDIFKNKSKQTTNEAVKYALSKLHISGYDIELNISKVTEVVSKIWGKKVMVFEYQFNMKEPPLKDIENIRGNFADSFEEFEAMHRIEKNNDSSVAFEMTDCWYLNGVLHIEVAYLINEETVLYSHDLKKVSLK